MKALLTIVIALALAVALAALFAFFVAWLINAVFAAPAVAVVFGGPVTWLQAWGLSVLLTLIGLRGK